MFNRDAVRRMAPRKYLANPCIAGLRGETKRRGPRGSPDLPYRRAPDLRRIRQIQTCTMPKFRVFIGETEVFDVDVAAPDEHAAIRKALDILPTAYRTAISHH